MEDRKSPPPPYYPERAHIVAPSAAPSYSEVSELPAERLSRLTQREQEIALCQIKHDKLNYRKLSPKLRSDFDVLITALTIHDAGLLKYASRELRGDRAIIRKAAQKSDSYNFALFYASKELQQDKHFMNELICSTPALIRGAPSCYRRDMALCLAAIHKWPYALQLFSHELRNDREIVKLAVAKGGTLALAFSGDKLRHDKELLELADAVDKRDTRPQLTLRYCTDKDKSDRELVAKIVGSVGIQLKYAAPELRDDPEIAKLAIKQNIYAAAFLSDRLAHNESFLLDVLAFKVQVLTFAPYSLLADQQFMKKAVRLAGMALEYASPQIKADPEIVLDAIRNRYEAFIFASEKLKADRAFILQAIGLSPEIYLMVDEELASDRDFVIEAAHIDPRIVSFAPEEIQDDPFIARIRSPHMSMLRGLMKGLVSEESRHQAYPCEAHQ